MTVTWERNVSEVVWESQTTPGITWATVVGGTTGETVPESRKVPTGGDPDTGYLAPAETPGGLPQWKTLPETSGSADLSYAIGIDIPVTIATALADLGLAEFVPAGTPIVAMAQEDPAENGGYVAAGDGLADFDDVLVAGNIGKSVSVMRLLSAGFTGPFEYRIRNHDDQTIHFDAILVPLVGDDRRDLDYWRSIPVTAAPAQAFRCDPINGAGAWSTTDITGEMSALTELIDLRALICVERLPDSISLDSVHFGEIATVAEVPDVAGVDRAEWAIAHAIDTSRLTSFYEWVPDGDTTEFADGRTYANTGTRYDVWQWLRETHDLTTGTVTHWAEVTESWDEQTADGRRWRKALEATFPEAQTIADLGEFPLLMGNLFSGLIGEVQIRIDGSLIANPKGTDGDPGDTTFTDGLGVEWSAGGTSEIEVLTSDDLPTPEEIGAATAAQGALADSALQSGSGYNTANGWVRLNDEQTIPPILIDSIFARDSEVDSKIAAALDALLDGAPGALDTLNELAAAIGDDASFAASVTSALAGKVPTARTLAGLDLTSNRSDAELRTALGLGSAALASSAAFDAAGAAATAQAAAVQRANHTGTQAISTVTNLQSSLDAKQAIVSWPTSALTPVAAYSSKAADIGENLFERNWSGTNITLNAGQTVVSKLRKRGTLERIIFYMVSATALSTDSVYFVCYNDAGGVPGTIDWQESMLISAVTLNANWYKTGLSRAIPENRWLAVHNGSSAGNMVFRSCNLNGVNDSPFTTPSGQSSGLQRASALSGSVSTPTSLVGVSMVDSGLMPSLTGRSSV